MKILALIVPAALALASCSDELRRSQPEPSPSGHDEVVRVVSADSTEIPVPYAAVINSLQKEDWAKLAQLSEDPLHVVIYDQKYDAEDHADQGEVDRTDQPDMDFTRHEVEQVGISLSRLERPAIKRLKEISKVFEYSGRDRSAEPFFWNGPLREIPDSAAGLPGRYASNCYWKLVLSPSGKLQAIIVGYH